MYGIIYFCRFATGGLVTFRVQRQCEHLIAQDVSALLQNPMAKLSAARLLLPAPNQWPLRLRLASA
jgi:hypothetical protein